MSCSNCGWDYAPSIENLFKKLPLSNDIDWVKVWHAVVNATYSNTDFYCLMCGTPHRHKETRHIEQNGAVFIESRMEPSKLPPSA